MLALVAAALAATSQAPTLEASIPWWERISVTVDGKGAQQSCTYQSSLSAAAPKECDEEMTPSIPARQTKAGHGVYSKLTFERRFSPGAKLDSGRLQTGDKLLGQRVMFLTIDQAGAIASCRVVATSGDMLPAYGCEQAKTEQFGARASASSEAPRQAFMTIMVYGHQEQIV